MSKHRLWWTVVALCSVLVALSGSGFAWAQPNGPHLAPGYALGYLGPEGETGHTSFSQPSPATMASGVESIDGWAEETVRLINLERRKVGLPPYKANPVLTATAVDHSAVMRDETCFSHQCAGEAPAAERARNAGYRPYGWGACYIGETIAAGFQDPASVVAAWMNSSGHRGILLHGQLREIGVGIVFGGVYGTYWTVDFGSQPDVLPVFINYDDPETDSQQVTLTLTNELVSGDDGIDYAKEVMISNDPNFAGAEWQGYELHKPWTLLPGNGQKAVYVRYRDPWGDMVTSSDDILLNVPVEYELWVSQHSLTFLYEVGNGFGSPPRATVRVDNAASSASMEWSATSSGPWIELNAGQSTTPGEFLVSACDFEADAPGTQETVITVTSPQDPDDTEQVTVTVRAVDKIYRVWLPLINNGNPTP